MDASGSAVPDLGLGMTDTLRQPTCRPIAVTMLTIFWFWSLLIFAFFAVDLRSLSHSLSAALCVMILVGLLMRSKLAALGHLVLVSLSLGVCLARIIFPAKPEDGPSAYVIVAGIIGAGALYGLQTSSALRWFDLPSSRMMRLLYWAASGAIAVVAEFWFGIQFSRHA